MTRSKVGLMSTPSRSRLRRPSRPAGLASLIMEEPSPGGEIISKSRQLYAVCVSGPLRKTSVNPFEIWSAAQHRFSSIFGFVAALPELWERSCDKLLRPAPASQPSCGLPDSNPTSSPARAQLRQQDWCAPTVPQSRSRGRGHVHPDRRPGVLLPEGGLLPQWGGTILPCTDHRQARAGLKCEPERLD